MTKRVCLVVAMLAGIVFASGTPAEATVYATYHVTTDVSARTSPTAAPGSGYGIPSGGAFGVQCQVIGEPVGPRGNTLYFYALYQGRSFYVPDTWTDSPHLAGQPPIAGIPMCGGAPPPGGGASVYYSGAGDAGWDLAEPYASYIMTENGSHNFRDWAIGSCGTSWADDFPAAVRNRTVTTLSGWSLGRLGPIYLIKQNPGLRQNINYILMFDPGTVGELRSCDASVHASQALATWLGEDGSNRLVIMAGEYTARNHHQSIQDIYFAPNIRGNATLSSRVLVCNVENNHVPWSHRDVIRGYAWMIAQPAPSQCPSGFLGWHP